MEVHTGLFYPGHLKADRPSFAFWLLAVDLYDCRLAVARHSDRQR